MLAAFENAVITLLRTALPTVFDGAGAASVALAGDAWDFDPLSADPVAGEPGAEDAVDDLPFVPAAPAGPHRLTRAPYPGPKRVYLRSAAGELVALAPAEVAWSASDPRSFTLAPRAGRDLSPYDHLRILYGIVSAATRVQTRHRVTLTITGTDAGKADEAHGLALSVIALNRAALMTAAAASWASGSYQASLIMKTLTFSSGAASATVRTLLLSAGLELRLQRLLGEDEGKPIAHIASPGREGTSRPVDIAPDVEA